MFSHRLRLVFGVLGKPQLVRRDGRSRCGTHQRRALLSGRARSAREREQRDKQPTRRHRWLEPRALDRRCSPARAERCLRALHAHKCRRLRLAGCVDIRFQTSDDQKFQLVFSNDHTCQCIFLERNLSLTLYLKATFYSKFLSKNKVSFNTLLCNVETKCNVFA